MTTPKQVCVKWLDACSIDKWYDKETIEKEKIFKPIIVLNTGFLILNNEERVVLGTSYRADSRLFQYIFVIPKTSVQEIKEIK